MREVALIKLFSKRSGGNIYRDQVFNALSENFKVIYITPKKSSFKNRYIKALGSFVGILLLKGEKDLWIRDFYSTVAINRKRTKGKNLSLIFHIDFSGFRLLAKILLPLIEKFFFYKALRKADAIVVISEYWKNYFLGKGYKNVYKIYCGFDLKNFDVSDQEILEFKRKHNLDGKPIIYLGNCQKPKGAADSYEALKSLDVHFVTSGKQRVKLPALNFDAGYREYLKLLKASTIAITMSKFKEGWCITTHEAMLLKTPIIGSGRGGMRELLDGGGQIVCRDFKDLKKEVELLLINPERRKSLGEKGYRFAKEFTMERFNKKWRDLVDEIL